MFFSKLKNDLEFNNFSPSEIWNIDKKGLLFGNSKKIINNSRGVLVPVK